MCSEAVASLYFLEFVAIVIPASFPKSSWHSPFPGVLVLCESFVSFIDILFVWTAQVVAARSSVIFFIHFPIEFLKVAFWEWSPYGKREKRDVWI